jgi:putative nucleotidyltransferase with HDIG domain
VIDNYTEKGFSDVYMPISEHQKYLTLCEIISSKVISSTKINPSDKLKSVFRLGNELAKNLLETGIEFPNLDYAETFLDQSVMMIKGLNLKDGHLKKFIKDIEHNEHTIAVSFLAGVIANELGFESSKSVKLVGLAALVHDVGLYDLAKGVDESSLAEDDEIMQKHAKHGADILRKSGSFDEVVCLAVEQHHLRRRSTNSLQRSNQMNLVSEIVGVADSFHNVVLANGFNTQKLDYFLNFELVKFSHQIEKALKKILEEKRKAS